MKVLTTWWILTTRKTTTKACESVTFELGWKHCWMNEQMGRGTLQC